MRPILCLAAFLAMTGTAPAQEIVFGDDSSEWANDGECDDRRFFGEGMATSLGWEHVGRDAADCRTALEAGRIAVWDFVAARAATDCKAIDFGDDSGEWAEDGECDDPRFEGLGSASLMVQDDLGRDASDCRRACEFGIVVLRDY